MTGLYLVTDEALCLGRSVEEVAVAAVRGGASMVQLREKELPTRRFVERAKRIFELLAPYRVPLIINDRVDVALASGAHGVHLGQGDMPFSEARRILGHGAIIGLSVETMAQVEEANRLDAAYLGISPVFRTPTKTDTGDGWGIEGISAIRRSTRHCLAAIGGLNADNAKAVIDSGADMIAVVAAVCSADDPEAAARGLVAVIREALAARARRLA
ncbi:MAG TPA: thiamine phosphate synthase [Magnetospirillaceae bacterium]|nr:thiamine phosphate synthase [Magnetospirillaceae bacterium]